MYLEHQSIVSSVLKDNKDTQHQLTSYESNVFDCVDPQFLQSNLDCDLFLDEYQFSEQLTIELIDSSYFDDSLSDESDFPDISTLVYSNNQIVFPFQDNIDSQPLDIQLILTSNTLIYMLQALTRLSDFWKVSIVAKRKLLSLEWIVDIPRDPYYASLALGIIHDYDHKLAFSGDIITSNKLITYFQDSCKIVFENNKIQIIDVPSLTKFSYKICQFSDKFIKKLPITHYTPSETVFKDEEKLEQENITENLKTVKFSLTQREVSSLIGVKGHRLNSIRIQSQCLIKVLPINEHNSLPRRDNPQEILVQGTPENVSIAIYEITTFISQQRLNNNKFH